MNNNLFQIKIKERLNKLASMDYDNFECWQIQEAANKAQLEWARRMVYGMNTRRESSEQSVGLVDDLRILLKDAVLTPDAKPVYAEGKLPDDYLYYVRVDAMAKNDCCPERRMTVYEVEEANIGILLNSSTKAPSWEWSETLSTLVGDKVRVYTDGKFAVTNMLLTYFRKPTPIKFLGCVDPATGQTVTVDSPCEFKDDIAEILADETAAILAADIESMNQYQRQVQNSQRNS